MTSVTGDSGEAERVEQRAVAIRSNAALNAANSSEEARARHQMWRAADPFPAVAPALLNSADIADYVVQTGMIYPFHADKLKSASYEVPLLGPYVFIDSKGKRREGELNEGEEIRIPKNSITFLTVEPYFRLPDYIALRHNLKIDHVYKGLLVGTGPLIDPGFVGRISLPLHNLTENDYTFVGGQGVIWVEFTKLSTLPPVHVATGKAVGGASSPPVSPKREGSYVSFDVAKTRERLVSGYVRSAVGTGDVPASSTAEIARTAAEANKTARRIELLVPTVGILGIVALMVALMNLVVLPRLSGFETDGNRQEDQISQLQMRIAELEDQVRDLSVARPRPAAVPRPSPSADR